MAHYKKSSLTGSGVPSAVTPEFIGQVYFDETNDNGYIAHNVTVGDWIGVVDLNSVQTISGSKTFTSDLIVGNSADASINIVSPDANTQYLHFSSPSRTGSYTGYVAGYYNSGADQLLLGTNGNDPTLVMQSGTVTIYGSLLPSPPATNDLGSATYKWDDGYINTLISDTITLASGVTVQAVLDEDEFTSNSATALATQQSIKAYADAEYVNTESSSESSTTDTAWQEKLNIDTVNTPSGIYRIGWSYEWAFSRTAMPGADFGIHLDWGTTVLFEVEVVPHDTYGNGLFELSSGFGFATLNGNHKIALNYNAGGTSSTAYIRRARMEIWRLP